MPHLQTSDMGIPNPAYILPWIKTTKKSKILMVLACRLI